MQVKGDFNARQGEGVEVDFERAGKANGIVVWCDGHVSGLKLEQAIEPSEFRKAAIESKTEPYTPPWFLRG